MVVETAPKKKGHKCNECEYLKYYGTQKFPYVCSIKHKGRHWTSKCICKKFKKKMTAQERLMARYNSEDSKK